MSFARLFSVPGMGHCAGGAATDSLAGQAPQCVPASSTVVYPDRMRLLYA